MSELIKLTTEQGDLAFHLLAIMEEHFPENPELTVAPLEVVLHAVKTEVEYGQRS